MPAGTGRNVGALFFDPQGADFTEWVNHFKNEVYRNWIIPQPALLGLGGRVVVQFAVDRQGRLADWKLLASSGVTALDRAAVNALRGSTLLPLPADFGPPQVVITLTFVYGRGSSPS